jgi:hypothetical protein
LAVKFEEPKPISNSSCHVRKMIDLSPVRRPSREQIRDEPEFPFFKPFSKQEYCMGSEELPVIMQILLG